MISPGKGARWLLEYSLARCQACSHGGARESTVRTANANNAAVHPRRSDAIPTAKSRIQSPTVLPRMCSVVAMAAAFGAF